MRMDQLMNPDFWLRDHFWKVRYPIEFGDGDDSY